MTQITVLSLGGGLQSTLLAEQILDPRIQDDKEQFRKLYGIDYPNNLVFMHADTWSETPTTMATVERLKKLAESYGIPFYIVRAEERGPIADYYKARGTRPMLQSSSCTTNWKILPINKKMQELVDKTQPKPWAEMWLGITTDEAHRCRPNPRKYATNRFPLVEMGYTRRQARNWMKENRPDVVVKKSGCYHCHFQGPKDWARLRREHPELFALARELEESAKAGGVHNWGLMQGRSIAAFDHGGVTLENFGFTITPEEMSCENGSGGCFL